MKIIYWNVDPILISFSGLHIHWYGVLFVLAIMSGFQIMKYIYTKENIPVDSLETLFLYCFIGIIVGARLGHCFFYDPIYYLNNPLKILATWEGGLASHGGGLGVILSIFLFHKKYNVNYLWLLDRLAIATAAFGFFVRIGNFINSEIIGIQSNSYFGVVFVKIDDIPRHPVQLYEAFSYISIFILLINIYKYTKIKDFSGGVFGIFLCLIFTSRFFIEFIKVKQSAYLNEQIITTGQLLSIPFIIIGLFLVGSFIKKANKARYS